VATDALELAEIVAQPFESAQVWVLLGTAMARRGLPDDAERARQRLTNALTMFEQLRAQPSAERAAAELGRLDSRPAARSASLSA
jgi:hypothetical protein